MTTQLIILPNGRAKEINPMGYDPWKADNLKGPENLLKRISIFLEWEQLESSLKEYAILNVDHFYNLKIGTVHNFKVNQEEGTCKIL